MRDEDKTKEQLVNWIRKRQEQAGKPMSRMKRVSVSRAALALGSWAVYVLAFTPLYRLLGPAVTALTGLPVIVTGWLFGMRAGLLAGLLGLLLDMLLVILAGGPWGAMLRRGLPGFVLLVLMGAVVGRLRDLGERVKLEFTERTRVEEALRHSGEETSHSRRLLLALSQAAQAVQRAHTPDEVYRAVGDQVLGLGFQATIATLTDDRAHLAFSYLTFKPALVRAAEKLMGLSMRDFRFPLLPGGLYQQVITEGETIFSESSVEFMTEALPGSLRPLAGRLATLLGLEQAIYAPLMVGGERYGLLTVIGAGLTEADVPAVTTFANQAAIALENTRAAEVLRESEAKYRNLTESLDELIYRADPETFVATYVNRAVERIYGYTVEEFLGDPTLWESTIHPEDKERVFAWFTEPQRKMESGAIEYRIIRKDKTVRWVEDHVSWEKDQQGNVVSLNGVLYDITERKRAEQALKTFATQLERSNRELQDFAYIASHDLQEPLRKIQAFGDRLETRYTGALDEQGRDYLQRMQQAARRMQRLINDLLAYSRVTTGGQLFVAVDLAQVAREVLSDLEVRLEQTGGQVEVGDSSTLRQAQDGAGLPKIQADPTQMRQLLQNLIGNALKFHREGVPPVIKLHAQISEVFETSEVSITVEDNGIGFNEKYLDRLFQPFQRLHGRQEYEGSGMGLAICRKIVERHGGSITARSTPGQGTTFIVVLPLKHSEGGT